MSGPAEAKQSARRAIRDALVARPLDARRAGEAAAAVLADHPLWPAIETLRLFAGLADEIDTRPLFEMARREGRRVAFPRCVDAELEFRWVLRWERLVPGRFGVREPPAFDDGGGGLDDLAALREAVPGAPGRVLWLVPGLAFDAVGARLGRGGGFYDRALARAAALREAEGEGERGRLIVAGLAFAAQRVDRVPVEAHDQRVDALLCEEGWHWASAGGEAPATTGES